MSNITITNNDLGSPILMEAQFRDAILAIAGADTILEGTILARKTLEDAVTGSVVTGTGDGVLTLTTVAEGPIVPLEGVYTLTNTETVVNGGIWKLVDPNGALVASDLQMTVGAGGTTAFETAGLKFSITDGATDFIAGDFFTMTTVANGKMVPFSPTGAGGAQIPVAILTFQVVTTGAEDRPIEMGVSGSYRKERLAIDGTAAGVGLTDAILDSLRVYDLVPIDTTQLSILDNQ